MGDVSDLLCDYQSHWQYRNQDGVSNYWTLFYFNLICIVYHQACADYLELAQTQGRKWQKSLQYERDQRLRLEETIETLAKQHNTLEQACREVKGKSTKGRSLSHTYSTQPPKILSHTHLLLKLV